MTWWITPFALQGFFMLVDEFYFHHKRGLGRWEIIGHPLDTLTVLASFLFLLLQPPTTQNLSLFVGLGFFSCLFITKDEFVHQRECEAYEQWLHALLFILHPIIFLVAGYLWWFSLHQEILVIQTVLIFLFMCYQVIFWSFKSGPNQQRNL